MRIHSSRRSSADLSAAVARAFQQATPHGRTATPVRAEIRAEVRTNGRSRASRVKSFRASTSAIDRHGTIVKPEGIRTERFDANSIVLWAHDGYNSTLGGAPSMDSVIGRVVGHRKSKDAFDVDIQFADAATNPQADLAFRLVSEGFLNAVSIGFVPLEVSEQRIAGRTVPVYESVELLEVSLVAIPSNPEALAMVRSLMRSPKYSGRAPGFDADAIAARIVQSAVAAGFAGARRPSAPARYPAARSTITPAQASAAVSAGFEWAEIQRLARMTVVAKANARELDRLAYQIARLKRRRAA